MTGLTLVLVQVTTRLFFPSSAPSTRRTGPSQSSTLTLTSTPGSPMCSEDLPVRPLRSTTEPTVRLPLSLFDLVLTSSPQSGTRLRRVSSRTVPRSTLVSEPPSPVPLTTTSEYRPFHSPISSLTRSTSSDADCGFTLVEARAIDSIGTQGIIDKIRETVGTTPVYLCSSPESLLPLLY